MRCDGKSCCWQLCYRIIDKLVYAGACVVIERAMEQHVESFAIVFDFFKLVLFRSLRRTYLQSFEVIQKYNFYRIHLIKT